MVLKNKNILIIAGEPFGDIFLSKHHYAIELAKKNTVYFLNSRGNRSQKELIKISPIDTNLFEIDYYNVYLGFGKTPFFIINWINSYISKKILNQIGFIDIVWSFEPAKFFNLKKFNPIYSIYHPVDYVPELNKYKIKIANSADIILSVSNEILETIKTNIPKYLINHGVREHIETSLKKLHHPINPKKINFAYVGNINIEYLDIENLKEAIIQNSTCDFHFIGPTGNSNLGLALNSSNYHKLSILPNVFFQGIVDQKQLINVMKNFDVLISCYDYKKHPIRLSNSHKILEYFSAGKMIISNFFPIYQDLNQEMLILIKENESFGSVFKSISEKIDYYNQLEFQEKRIAFAKKNTYKNQIKKIEEILLKINK